MFYEGMEFGNYDRAERKADKAHELYEDGQMTQALEELETALEINPTNSSWHFDKGLALDSMHRFEEAVKEYETAIELSPGDLEILNSLAVDYTRTGQYDRAIETFEDIQHQDPSFEPAYCNRIIAYTEMGLHELAEQMFYLAQQINPTCALCYYNIGNSLYVRGEYQKAIGCWQRTAELEPTHPQIHYRIAQAHWALGHGEEAKEHFLTELRGNPGDLDVILDYGLFLLGQGDLEAAREKFNRVLEFEPDHAMALFYRGEIALHEGQDHQAMELYNQALRSDDSLPGPYFRLAQYALQQNKWQKTRAYLISELRNVSDNPEVLTAMGSMFLMIAQQSHDEVSSTKRRSAFGCNDLDHAGHCLLRAVEMAPNSADLHYYLGLASSLRGLDDQALDFFGRALEVNPDHIRALRDAARIYLRRGKPNQAAQMIARARELAGEDADLKMLARHCQEERWAGTLQTWIKQLKKKVYLPRH